jgi:hypothetical protein
VHNISVIGTAFIEIDQAIGKKERAPILAVLHLDTLLTEETKMTEEDYMDVMKRYWGKWGSKGVVVEDIMGACKGREALLASPVQSWSEEPHVSSRETTLI